MKSLILTLVLTAQSVLLFAQSDSSGSKSKKITKWILPELGVVVGAQEPSEDYRITAGIQKGKWTLGVGAAFDKYRFESFPLYVQVGRQFKVWKLRPYAFGSLGYNHKDGVDSAFNFSGNFLRIASRPTVYNYEGGIFAEVGAGMAIRIKGKERLMVSGSMSQKQVIQWYSTPTWLAPGVTRPVTSRDVYVMNRYTIRLGWRFSWK